MRLVLSTIIQFLPFIIILWAANICEGRRAAGKPHRGWRIAVYALLSIALVLALVSGLLLQILGAVAQDQATARQLGGVPGISAELLQAAPRVGLGLWLPAIIGLALLLVPVRRALARLIPIDASNTVHTVALVYAMFVLSQLLTTTGLGLANVAGLLESADISGADLISVFWTQDITWLLMALIGVGWLSRKGLRQALPRLGLVTPTARQLALGVGLGVVLALSVTGALSLAGKLGIVVNQDVERLSELLVGPLTQSMWGVLTLGLAAAIGEESLLRGALQPRFGLLLTSLIFTLLHAQYGFSLATLIILAVGLILGLVRNHHNTVVAMLVHALYNITLGLLALLGS